MLYVKLIFMALVLPLEALETNTRYFIAIACSALSQLNQIIK